MHCKFFSFLLFLFETFAENSNGTTDVDSDAEMHQLFTPFRGYCARKGVPNLSHQKTYIIIVTLDPLSKMLS